jgi:Tol biopolymer transport system component/tRNA A-37 threonylcarbamoyl transferase component Bud32
MGEVYRARDRKLERDVALKILPERLVTDPRALARFEREAKAVAALSHPNILSIFDFGNENETAFAAMELLEGETLAARLARGALPLRKSLDIATQVARGLAAAHERGIVHRDLKPDNVFLIRDGRVKILDFGIARQVGIEALASSSEVDTTPPQGPATAPGTILGTVGYMAPEQVRAQPFDQRCDIFSLGVILYEMLTGHRAFQGASPIETMSAILREEPPEIESMPEGVSPALARLLRRCLEKRPQARFHSAADLAFALEALADPSAAAGSAREVGSAVPLRFAVPASLAAGAMAGIAALLLLRGITTPPTPDPVRVRPLTFSGRDSEPAASPDGRLVAYSSSRDGRGRIWLKQVAGGVEAPLTEGPDRRPRFAADGSSVFFLRNEGRQQSLYRVAVVGGSPRKVLDDVQEAEPAPDGRILAFVRYQTAQNSRGTAQLRTFDLSSGVEELLVEDPANDLLFPRFSPDGKRLAVVRGNAAGNGSEWDVLTIDLERHTNRSVTIEGTRGPLAGLAWLGDSGKGDEVVLAMSGSVVGDVSGAPSRVVRADLRTGRRTTLFWASDLFVVAGRGENFSSLAPLGPGTLLFDQTTRLQNLREVPIGNAPSAGLARELTSGGGRDRQPAYSPDGRSVLLSSNQSGNLDLWMLDLATGSRRQLTDDPAQDWDPAFTPDGRSVLWSSDRGGHLEIWIAKTDGSAARQVSQDGADAENPTMTRDGRWIVYGSGNPKKTGIWRVRPDGSAASLLVPGVLSIPEVSPDGRYALYVDIRRDELTNTIQFVEVETGKRVPFEIAVTYNPSTSSESVVWGRARWSADGKRILFIGQDETGRSGIYSQEFASGHDVPAARQPVAGFSPDYLTESLGASPDGKRLTLSTLRRSGTILIAEGIEGLTPPTPVR